MRERAVLTRAVSYLRESKRETFLRYVHFALSPQRPEVTRKPSANPSTRERVPFRRVADTLREEERRR